MWILDQERFLIQQCYRNLSIVPERSRTRRQFPQMFYARQGALLSLNPLRSLETFLQDSY